MYAYSWWFSRSVNVCCKLFHFICKSCEFPLNEVVLQNEVIGVLNYSVSQSFILDAFLVTPFWPQQQQSKSSYDRHVALSVLGQIELFGVPWSRGFLWFF